MILKKKKVKPIQFACNKIFPQEVKKINNLIVSVKGNACGRELTLHEGFSDTEARDDRYDEILELIENNSRLMHDS